MPLFHFRKLFHFENLYLQFGGLGFGFMLTVHQVFMNRLALHQVAVTFMLSLMIACAGMVLATFVMTVVQWVRYGKNLFFMCLALAASCAALAGYGMTGLLVIWENAPVDLFWGFQRNWMTGFFAAIIVGIMMYCLAERSDQKKIARKLAPG
jgi:hypothetical protein